MSLKTWSIICFLLFPCLFGYSQDWPQLGYYAEQNNEISITMNDDRVVFFGDSITEGWPKFTPDFFEGQPYINRGISGQTTSQMLVRFRQDVIHLNPKLVIILAGTNDIAGNTGPASNELILDNLISMVELAKASDIKVVLSSIHPVKDYPWKPGLEPSQRIIDINNELKAYAQRSEVFYLDYFSAMVDDEDGLYKAYTYDGVHPNKEGYLVMNKLAVSAIQLALEVQD